MATKLVAATALLAFFAAARLPTLTVAERQQLAAQFRFVRMELGQAPRTARNVRPVHPAVQHLSAWISSVGASVALADIDHDGLANDYCLVDPRTDEVFVAPVPATPHRFEAFVLGLDVVDPVTAPMGCRVGDFNEDALADVLVYYWGRPPVAFLRRAVPAGQPFPVPAATAYRAVDVAPAGERWNTNALTTADVDGDGHVDLVVANYFPDGSLPLDSESTGDFDMHDSMARSANGGVNRILLWEGAETSVDPSVRFREASVPFPMEVARGWTLAVGAADLDGDQLPEIYFANDFGPDRLLHNRSRPGHVELVAVTGKRSFTTPNSKALGRDSFKGMGVDFGDLNDDGVLDLFVSNIANEHALEESHFAFVSNGDNAAAELRAGRAPYVDRSEPLGLSRSAFSWDARLADLNNDGVLEALQASGFIRGSVNRWPELQELAMGNNKTIRLPASWPRFMPGDDISGDVHSPFFVRSASGRYYDMAEAIGLGRPQIARGIAMADIDGDGDMDFAVARQWDTSDFYRNDQKNGNVALNLRLMVPIQRPGFVDPTRIAARPAIGATARLRLPDGRARVAHVDGGNGHTGARAPEIHFGLGRSVVGSTVTVELEWRDQHGTVQRKTRQFTIGDKTTSPVTVIL